MPDYLVNPGIPAVPNGLPDKEHLLVSPLYRGVWALAQQLSALTGNVQYGPAEMAQVDQLVGLLDNRAAKVIVQASEALAYGQLVTLDVALGKISASVADASIVTKPAHAVVDTPGGIALGAFGNVVFMSGRTLGISGTTLGATYYLSTAGAVQLAPPTATGVLSQVAGIGLGSAGFYLNIEPISRRVTHIYKPSAAVLRVQYADGSFTDNAV